MQQACGTGLQAVIAVANKIALGQIDVGVAGGADTTSDAPLGVNDELRRVLLAARRAKTWRTGCASSPACDRATCAPTSRATPNRAPGCRWASTPRVPPASGASAAGSRTSWPPPATNLATAYDSGFLHDLVVPFRGLARDQNLRPAPRRTSSGSWSPSSGRSSAREATMTAGNSTPLTDGAAIVLLA